METLEVPEVVLFTPSSKKGEDGLLLNAFPDDPPVLSERTVAVTGVMRAFQRLRKPTLTGLESFIKRFGPLPLCSKHYGPLGHVQAPRYLPEAPGTKSRRRFRPTPCRTRSSFHPLQVYGGYAQLMYDTERLAIAIRQFHGEYKERTSWSVFSKDHKLSDLRAYIETWFSIPGPPISQRPDSLGDLAKHERKLVERSVNWWLEIGAIRETFTWRKAQHPSREIHGTNLWGVLAQSLVATVVGENQMAICRRCGRPYQRRSPTPHGGRPPMQCADCHTEDRAYSRRRAQRFKK